MSRYHYEDAPEYDATAYTIGDSDGVAWHILGWHTEPDEETVWSGCENRTGYLIGVMVGDDSHFLIDPEDVIPLAEGDYCRSCGQIGCCHAA